MYTLDSGCKRVRFGPKNSARTQPDTYVGLGRVGSNLNICCPDPNPSWDFSGSVSEVVGRTQSVPPNALASPLQEKTNRRDPPASLPSRVIEKEFDAIAAAKELFK
ncbi:hypothetical protein PGTUg99_007149, partial [Puccinia graminis f. sp. tritici]